MTDAYPEYSIGTPGKPWTEKDKQAWLDQQYQKRSYFEEVAEPLNQLRSEGLIHELIHYGTLHYQSLSLSDGANQGSAYADYPLYCAIIGEHQAGLPNVLVTGGVHGYETSGVQGAIAFIRDAASAYKGKANIIVLPCLSPWGYETINRWNPFALDPNRSFIENSPSQEAKLAMACVAALDLPLNMHIDLHETTDSDNTEFRPALAARDAIEQKVWDIPDGFYTVGDTSRPKPDFQRAIIKAVESVTHIALADKDDKIIGADVEQHGVINYDKKSLHLCGGFTDAPYVSTTEVYPDSPNANDEICAKAQVAAITGAIEHVLSQLS